jgi:hypothetical protein
VRFGNSTARAPAAEAAVIVTVDYSSIVAAMRERALEEFDKWQDVAENKGAVTVLVRRTT